MRARERERARLCFVNGFPYSSRYDMFSVCLPLNTFGECFAVHIELFVLSVPEDCLCLDHGLRVVDGTAVPTKCSKLTVSLLLESKSWNVEFN